jgi:hypothetical protein
VACYRTVGKRPELEVLTYHSNVRVEALEMLLVVNRLQEDSACGSILGLDAFLQLFTNYGFSWDVVFINCNNQVIHNHLGNLTVHVTFSGLASKVAFETVTTVKVFTDVMANVVANQEAASRMLVHEFTYVKHQIVK